MTKTMTYTFCNYMSWWRTLMTCTARYLWHIVWHILMTYISMTYTMTHNIYQLHILMTYIDDICRQYLWHIAWHILMIYNSMTHAMTYNIYQLHILMTYVDDICRKVRMTHRMTYTNDTYVNDICNDLCYDINDEHRWHISSGTCDICNDIFQWCINMQWHIALHILMTYASMTYLMTYICQFVTWWHILMTQPLNDIYHDMYVMTHTSCHHDIYRRVPLIDITLMIYPMTCTDDTLYVIAYH